MKATELLKQQHRDVEKLFKVLEDDEGDEKQTEIFGELAATLVAHDAIEREIFYPACEKALGMTDLLGEALVEHGVIEFSLYEADEAQGKKDFDFKLKVLEEMVEHHVEEEEKELFPEVEDAIEAEELETLGQRMEQRFSEARAEDYRAPLHENLRQVLAGAIKPKKAKTSGGKPRAHRKSA
ncbi:MAG TPA: hemerythrin domain-containing protein [Polyangiaceae bacterium]|nr:hemerythrin domain-containing protein [Polyangiaceae bacterium]